VSIFIQAKISNGNYQIDGTSSETTALDLASNIIPEVGTILKVCAAALELKNEN